MVHSLVGTPLGCWPRETPEARAL